MKKIMKWRYYCEFCKKSGASSGHMKKHEAGCTMNPNRFCGHCKIAHIEQQPITELLKAFGIGDKEGMQKLRELSDGCPSCILATIRQSGVMNDNQPDEDGYPPLMAWMDFRYKDEKSAFWSDINEERSNYSGYY